MQPETEKFAKLVESLRFDDAGKPAWDRPDGWTQRLESGFRYATLTRDGSDPPLEITVSTLPADDPAGDEYLKSNIDRWRGQVGLPPYSGTDWRQQAESAGELREVTAAGGRAVLVQLAGQDPQGNPVLLVAAVVPRTGGTAAPSRPAATAAAPVAAGEPSYKAPPEWTPEPPRQFQTALWAVTSGGERVEISVSQSGGTVEANVARWRGQVGLGPGAAGEVIADTTVAGLAAKRVELKGAETAIVGLIVPRGASSWFVKMMGPSSLVEQERSRFDRFVETLRFE